MRGLFTKIFLGFWIAQSLTFVISTMLILQHRFVGAHEIIEVLNTTLPSTVGAAVNAYETGGCAGLHQYGASIQQTIYLADTPKHFLCGVALSSATAAALAAADTKAGVYTNLDGDDYLWSTAMQSAGGQRYLFLLSRRRAVHAFHLGDLLHFAFPQLPVGIVVFGLTTFIMVLLLVRPIGRLRLAARKLANGELATRVDEPSAWVNASKTAACLSLGMPMPVSATQAFKVAFDSSL